MLDDRRTYLGRWCWRMIRSFRSLVEAERMTYFDQSYLGKEGAEILLRPFLHQNGTPRAFRSNRDAWWLPQLCRLTLSFSLGR